MDNNCESLYIFTRSTKMSFYVAQGDVVTPLLSDCDDALKIAWTESALWLSSKSFLISGYDTTWCETGEGDKVPRYKNPHAVMWGDAVLEGDGIGVVDLDYVIDQIMDQDCTITFSRMFSKARGLEGPYPIYTATIHDDLTGCLIARDGQYACALDAALGVMTRVEWQEFISARAKWVHADRQIGDCK